MENPGILRERSGLVFELKYPLNREEVTAGRWVVYTTCLNCFMCKCIKVDGGGGKGGGGGGKGRRCNQPKEH